MVVRFVLGDTLTGRRLQNIPAKSGEWSEELNKAGSVSCSVTLRDPAIQRLDLRNSAAPGKAFLAALEGDTVLQAGPVWSVDYDDQTQELTLNAEGLWSYFDRRVLLPDNGSAPTSPDAATNVISSLQGIARYYVEQALAATGGDLPVILPDEIAGTNERNEDGANLSSVGERLSDLTQVTNGPDIQFAPQLATDRLGIEWVMRIGTPTQPMLYAPQDIVFNVNTAGSSVSNLRITHDGYSLASKAYVSGGRGADEVLIAVDEDPTLLDLGYPLLEVVDSSHGSVIEEDTLADYAVEATYFGRYPLRSISFDHDTTYRPFANAFTVGDFASVRIKDHPFYGTETVRMRVVSRSGSIGSPKVSIELQPEPTDG